MAWQAAQYMTTHDEIVAYLKTHIEHDRTEHDTLMGMLDEYVDKHPDAKDRGALRMLLMAHMERTEMGHARLLVACERLTEDEQ